jgi:hypothetical protein
MAGVDHEGRSAVGGVERDGTVNPSPRGKTRVVVGAMSVQRARRGSMNGVGIIESNREDTRTPLGQSGAFGTTTSRYTEPPRPLRVWMAPTRS